MNFKERERSVNEKNELGKIFLFNQTYKLWIHKLKKYDYINVERNKNLQSSNTYGLTERCLKLITDT